MSKEAKKPSDFKKHTILKTSSIGSFHIHNRILGTLLFVAIAVLILTLISSKNNNKHDSKYVGTYIGKDGSGLTLHPDGSAELYTFQMDAVETGDSWKNSKNRLTVKSIGYNGYTLYADIKGENTNEFNLTCDDKNKWLAEDFYKISEEDKSLAKADYDNIWAMKFGVTSPVTFHNMIFSLPKYYSIVEDEKDYQSYTSVDKHSRIGIQFISTKIISNKAPSIIFDEMPESINGGMDNVIKSISEKYNITAERTGSSKRNVATIDGIELEYNLKASNDYPVSGKGISIPLNDQEGVLNFIFITEGNGISNNTHDFDDMIDSATYSGKIIDEKPSNSVVTTINADQVKVSSSSSDYMFSTDNYKDVVLKFKNDGFADVNAEPVYDIIFGITPKESVSSVTIDGNSNFSKGDIYSKSAKVIIKYHMPYDSDPNNQSTSGESSSSVSLSDSKDETQADSSQYKMYERAVVVGLTNAQADDVWTNDEYDPKKFHSYADLSGFFLELYSDGTWSKVNDYTWHVDHILLSPYELSSIFDASCDVSFDGSKYCISNMSGYIRSGSITNEEAAAKGLGTNLTELQESSDAVTYFIIDSSLVEEERDDSKITEMKREKDKEELAARQAFEKAIKQWCLPYDSKPKIHWITEEMQHYQGADGVWYFQVGFEAKNAYAQKIHYIAEGGVDMKNGKYTGFTVSYW